MCDNITPSQTLSKPCADHWLQDITDTESDLNCLLSLIAPDMLCAGMEAISQLKDNNPDHNNLKLWSSAFSAITVIVNRITFAHRDQGGWPACFDFLVVAGDYEKSTLDVADLGAKFNYEPGTVVAICGKVLWHSVWQWTGGEQICYVHYMCNNVHNRLNVRQTSWVRDRDYFRWMSPGFLRRTKRVV
jgi:hypothetical protein